MGGITLPEIIPKISCDIFWTYENKQKYFSKTPGKSAGGEFEKNMSMA